MWWFEFFKFFRSFFFSQSLSLFFPLCVPLIASFVKVFYFFFIHDRRWRSAIFTYGLRGKRAFLLFFLHQFTLLPHYKLTSDFLSQFMLRLYTSVGSGRGSGFWSQYSELIRLLLVTSSQLMLFILFVDQLLCLLTSPFDDGFGLMSLVLCQCSLNT